MKKLIKTPILITGSTGFIGANLTHYLVSAGYEVHLIIKNQSNTWRLNSIINNINFYNADLIEFDKIELIINKIKPKTIFHLATYGAYPYQNEMDKIKFVNLDCTINLLRICEKHNFDIFINTGSNSEYGFKEDLMKESDILEPNSYYSVFKSASTLFCQYESIHKELPIVTLRPFHVYGPYEEPTRFMPVLINNLLNNNCPPLVSPHIKRDMIYIQDLIDFYIMVSTKLIGLGKIFNIGSGVQYSIEEIVKVAIDITNSTVRPQWNTMSNRVWDSEKWGADMSLVQDTYNWEPNYNLYDGMKKTIQWYKNKSRQF